MEKCGYLLARCEKNLFCLADRHTYLLNIVLRKCHLYVQVRLTKRKLTLRNLPKNYGKIREFCQCGMGTLYLVFHQFKKSISVSILTLYT